MNSDAEKGCRKQERETVKKGGYNCNNGYLVGKGEGTALPACPENIIEMSI